MTQVFRDVACPHCGCVCDDIELRVEATSIIAADGACAAGKTWFLNQKTPTETPAPVADGVRQAADILSNSRALLIYGLDSSSTPGIRAAVELAEILGATIDPALSPFARASTLALQSVGMSTATLGEVRNRADLVIYWGSDPLASHPRHFERFVEAPGTFVPGGRTDRRVIVIDSEQTATAAMADQFIQLKPGGDFEHIGSLRAALKGIATHEVQEEVSNLIDQMKSCRYGAIFFGPGIASHGVAHATIATLLGLVTELNAHTRFVAQPMRSGGAPTVLTWLTGYPMCINFAHGYPRYGPDEFSAERLLERGEVDAVVLVGADGISQLSSTAQQSLARLPLIALLNPNETCSVPAAVLFTTAVYGIHSPGTAYRMDGVPLPLRKILDSPLPTDAEILAAIRQECAHALSNV